MSVCDIPVISSVCDAVGEGVASLVAAPFDWLAQAMGAAAGWLFQAVWGVFDTTTLVDVTGAEYVGVYNLLFGVAIFVMLVFFCLQLITGLIRRDPGALPRAALGLAKSVLGSFVALTLTGTLLEITDQLCIGIVQATGNSMQDMGDKIALLGGALAGINIAAPGVGAIITIFLAGLAISAAAIVWFSLLVRKALLLVAIVFAPVALAGASWDATRGWFGKWATFVLALILSKLVLVVVFLVAIAQVSQPIDLDLASISDPIAGVVLMLVAAFAPYMTYKFISFVGFDMYHAMSAEQEAKSAMNRPVPVPTGGGNGASPKKILDGGDGPSGGGRPPAPTGQPSTGGGAGAAAGGAAPAAGGGAAASSGAGAGATAGGGAAAGGAAAAGPVGAAVVVGAKVAGAAATAGPKAGNAVAAAAGGHADAAEPATTPPSTP
ncbi:conjugal transfer protein TrbL, partial [Microbacterium sp. p3-SID336]